VNGSIANDTQNMLRQSTHASYYANHTVFQNPEQVLRGHLDHCIEILRQQLMCIAEMAPMFTYDSPVVEVALPDFNSVLMCRNFGDLYRWTKENMVVGGGDWEIPE
jgi:hypothetical protein